MEYLETFSKCHNSRQTPEETTKAIEDNKEAMELRRSEWFAPEPITDKELRFI